jgi:hypothetical protein
MSRKKTLLPLTKRHTHRRALALFPKFLNVNRQAHPSSTAWCSARDAQAAAPISATGGSASANPPPAPWSTDTDFGKAWVFDRSAELDPDVWSQAFRGQVRDHRFYEVTEGTLADQFEQHYFLLEHRASGLYAVQPFFFVHQDLTAGLPLAMRTRVQRWRRRSPKLFSSGCSWWLCCRESPGGPVPRPCGFEPFAQALLQFGRVALCPPPEGDVVHGNPALLEQVLDVARYQRIDRRPESKLTGL